jgi:hypothetical protein
MQTRLDEANIESKDSSRGIRLYAWNIATRLWRTSPGTGVGPGHYDVRYREFRPELLQARPQYAHNDYLNTLADWGVIGLTLVLATVGLAYWSVARSWKFLQRQSLELVAKRGARGAQHSNRAAFVLGAGAGVAALLVHSAFDFNMQIPANALIVVSLLALMAGHLRFATESHWLRGGVFTRLAFTLAALLLAAGARPRAAGIGGKTVSSSARRLRWRPATLPVAVPRFRRLSPSSRGISTRPIRLGKCIASKAGRARMATPSWPSRRWNGSTA